MISRRRMLIASGLAGSAALLSRSLLGAPNTAVRQIALANLHTGEKVTVEYFRDDAYVPGALGDIDRVLRDFRSGEKHAIDPKLIDYLVDVAAQIGMPPAFSVISGFRSPATNESLQERNGASQQSLHIEGRAIDVRMGGVGCKDFAAHAERLKRGGVGFYRDSNFVHLDTGAFRTWRG